MRRMLAGILIAVLSGVCAAADVKIGGRDVTYGYILVFTVPKASPFGQNYADCGGDCIPPHGKLGDLDVFAVKAVTTRAAKSSQGMYSPAWVEPNLDIAQRDANCLLTNLAAGKDKDVGEISSAYLIQVVAAAVPKDAQPQAKKEDRCVWRSPRDR